MCDPILGSRRRNRLCTISSQATLPLTGISPLPLLHILLISSLLPHLVEHRLARAGTDTLEATALLLPLPWMGTPDFTVLLTNQGPAVQEVNRVVDILGGRARHVQSAGVAFVVHGVRVVRLANIGVDGIGTEGVLWGSCPWWESLGVVLWCGLVALLVAGLMLWQCVRCWSGNLLL